MGSPCPLRRDKPAETSSKDVPRRRRPAAALKHLGGRVSRHTLQVLAVIVGLILLVVIASFFVDEPMRRQMEKRMNESLTGYTVRIGDLDFTLFGFSITLHDLSIVQDAHPNPPVALIPRLRASVQWSELLNLHLVADFQARPSSGWRRASRGRARAGTPPPPRSAGRPRSARPPAPPLRRRLRVPTTLYNLACAYSLMDRKDEAFTYLFGALDAGFDGHALRGDDDLDNLRGDPRFRQALARLKDGDGHEDWND